MNIEAQKEFYEKYSLVTRGIFYGVRMLSAQLNTEFQHSDYDNIKKVYSIWICMNAPNKIGNAMTRYSIKKQDIIGSMPAKRRSYDKLSVVMICLNEEAECEQGGLHRLLNTLLSKRLSIQEKAQILSKEYNIPLERDLKEVAGSMCNLSEAIEEEGIRKGLSEGIRACVEVCRKFGVSREDTIKEIMEKFSKPFQDAEKDVEAYWN